MKGLLLAAVAIQMAMVQKLDSLYTTEAETTTDTTVTYFDVSSEDSGEADTISTTADVTVSSQADRKNCTIDFEANNRNYPHGRKMLKSFEILSDCLDSCGDDSVCSGVEFDFSNQSCIRKTCDPLHQAGGTKCKAQSNIKVVLNRTSAYTCRGNGCGEENPSGRVAKTDCTNSGTTNGGFCPAQTTRFIDWPETVAGTESVRPCPNRSEGSAKWLCGRDPAEWVEHPDLSDCRSKMLDDVRRQINNTKGGYTKEGVNKLLDTVSTISTRKDLVGGDLTSLTIVTGDILKESESLLNNTKQEMRNSLIQNLSRAFVEINSNLLELNLAPVWLDLPEKTQTETANRMMSAVEEGGKVFANAIDANQSLKIIAPNIVLEVRNFPKTEDKHGNRTLLFPSPTNDTKESAPWFQAAGSISIPEASFKHNTTDPIRIVFSFFNDLEKWLQPSNTSSSETEESDSNNSGMAPESHLRFPSQRLINSKIISASVVNAKSSKRYELKEPMRYVLAHNEIRGFIDPVCVFWNNYDKATEGRWSTDGCRLVNSDNTHTTCECDHLTNFAVLMSVTAHEMSEAHRFSLSTITCIGCGISMVCQVLAFITFNIFKNLQSDLNTVHKHLVLNLFIAQLIFLIGIGLTSKQVLCSIVAGSLHFFFLTAFAWMCLEGVQLYLMLVKVFEAKKSLVKWYYAAAYGSPAVIVATTAAVAHGGYGTRDYCWLSVANGVIWAFVGPVVVILAMNIVMLCIALCTIFRSSGTSAAHKKQHKTTAENIGSCIEGAFVLMILLGTTWVFGLFYINQHSIFMAYLFTIFNSLQGFFIFVFHCLQKEKVQKEYKRWIQRNHWLPDGIRVRFGGVGASPTASSAGVTYSTSFGAKKFSLDGNIPYKVSDKMTDCPSTDLTLDECTIHNDPDDSAGKVELELTTVEKLSPDRTTPAKLSDNSADGPSNDPTLVACTMQNDPGQSVQTPKVEDHTPIVKKPSVDGTPSQTPSEINPACPSADSNLVDTNTTDELVQTTATEQGLL